MRTYKRGRSEINDDGDGYDGRDSISCSDRLSVGDENALDKDFEIVGPARSLTIEWLNCLEAADFLRLSVKALRNLTSNGQVPFYKFGRRVRYRKNELEALLLSQKRGK